MSGGIDGLGTNRQPDIIDNTDGTGTVQPKANDHRGTGGVTIGRYQGGSDDGGYVADDHSMEPSHTMSSAAILFMLINTTASANQSLATTTSDLLDDQNNDMMEQNQKRADEQAKLDQQRKHPPSHFWEDFAKVCGASVMMLGGLAVGVATFGAGSEVTAVTTMAGTALISSVAVADALHGFDNLPDGAKMPVMLSLYAVGAAMTLGANLPGMLSSIQSFAQAAAGATIEGTTEMAAGAGVGAEELLMEGAETGALTGLEDADAFAQTMAETAAAASEADTAEEAANIFVTGLRKALIEGGVDTGQLSEESEAEFQAAIEAAMEQSTAVTDEAAPAAIEEGAEVSDLGEGVTASEEADQAAAEAALPQEGDETFGADLQPNDPPANNLDAEDVENAVTDVAPSQQEADELGLDDEWVQLEEDSVGMGIKQEQIEGDSLTDKYRTWGNRSQRASRVVEGVAKDLDEKNQADILRNKAKTDESEAKLAEIKGESDRIQSIIDNTKPTVTAYATKVHSTINDTSKILSNLDAGSYIAAEHVGAPPMGAMS